MLEKIDLTKKMDKDEYQKRVSQLGQRLGELQRLCRQLDIPVLIVFEGYDASGKGVQIGRMIQNLDPRGFRVYAVKNETEEERMHPFLWRFWDKMPANGNISIFDSSWYQKVLAERFEKKSDEHTVENAFRSILSFERQITDGGMVLIKLFLDIDKKEQKQRFEKLEKSKETAWRVTKEDWKRNRAFEQYEALNEEMLQKTDTDYAPWNIVEAVDKRFAEVKILSIVNKALETAAKRVQKERIQEEKHQKAEDGLWKELEVSTLSKTDLSLTCPRETYKKKLKKLQKNIALLHNELYRRRIPVVIGFEGWDAGGKGGAIRRLTAKMDPRGFVVNPVCAPNDIEKVHHYLWRFWKTMPKAGHIAIYDRTWYGRVMVERIEGFCTEQEWKRAYREINDMEKDLADAGAIVLKFWMHIDKEEQARRFRERQENPKKQWKITEEDWRNREKWDAYEKAVNEMLIRTSTPYAPWIVVEGNDKRFARIKVLETVADAIEKRIAKEKNKES